MVGFQSTEALQGLDRLVATLEHMQVPNGTGPGVWRRWCLLFACHIRCKRFMETSRNLVNMSNSVRSKNHLLVKNSNIYNCEVFKEKKSISCTIFPGVHKSPASKHRESLVRWARAISVPLTEVISIHSHLLPGLFDFTPRRAIGQACGSLQCKK